MSFRPKYLGALAMAFTLALSACTDTTGPVPGSFDADATTSSVEAVEASFNSAAFESFAVLGPEFAVGGAAASTSAALVANARHLDSRDLTQQAEAIAYELAAAMAPAAVLIPEEYWGVYVYVPGEGYVLDAEAGTPVNGVRFMLYAVNPVTKDIAEPLNEIGYADLIDESTEQTAAVRLMVVSDEVTYLDYSVSTTGPITSPIFNILGYVTDGVDRADFDLSVSFEFTFAGSTVDILYDIDVNDANILVDLHFEGNSEGEGSGTIDFTFSHGENTVTVVGTIEAGIGDFEVQANGQLFATITTTETTVTVLGPNEEPLSAEHAAALRKLVDMIEDVMDTWEELFHPVEFLFGG